MATPPNGNDLPPLDQTVITGGAPSDAPNHFGGASDLGSAPSLVYPPDGVMMPPNISMLEVQLQPATGTDLFEIKFTTANLSLKVYTGCVAVGSGCGFLPDEATWKIISDYGRGTTMKIELRATGPSGKVGSAAPRTMSFTDEDLLGGLYYWAAANGAVNRYDFGLRNQKAENFYTPATAGAMCVGCHVLSRDGGRIAVGLNVPGPATLRVLDVATRTQLFESAGGIGPGGPASGGSNFEALAPDGSKVLVNSGNDLLLEDAATGTSLGSKITNANMPDWSGDGLSIVFAGIGTGTCIGGFCPSQPGVDSASLMLVDVSGTTFGTPTTLVAASGNNNYYPSFSPDAKWVGFNRSTMNSYDAPDAKVMVVGTGAGASPLDLPQVNAIQGNSWPKFAPYTQHFAGKTIFWLTFSSRRDYGLRIVQSGNTKDMQVAQIWMVAFSPDDDEAHLGYPPFWLPFQDATTGNHIAQWTEKVARQPCTPGPDNSGCPVDEMCMNGECVPNPIM
jgi:hypothetical protein